MLISKLLVSFGCAYLEEGRIVCLGKDGQFAADGGIQHLTSGFLVSLAGYFIADLGRIQVGQLPAETFPKIARIEVIGVIAVRDDGFVGITFASEVVIHANQDDLFKAHIKSKLQRDVSDRRAFPDATGHVIGKLRTSIGRVKKNHVIREALEVAIGMPGDELGNGQSRDLFSALLDDQVVYGSKVSSGKAQLREH